MIEDKSIAKEINQLFLECSSKIDYSVVRVHERCSDAEYQAYRKAAELILGDFLEEVFKPLYEAHPELKTRERH